MPDSSELPNIDQINSVVHDLKRLSAVRATDSIANQNNPIFKQLSLQASKLLNAPIALISLVEEDADIIYGQTGLPEYIAKAGRIESQPSFCQLTVAANKPVIISDVRKSGSLRLFPSVSKQGIQSHLGIPLTVDGQTIGNCCVIDFKPHQWTEQDIATLTRLAEEATDQLSTTIETD